MSGAYTSGRTFERATCGALRTEGRTCAACLSIGLTSAFATSYGVMPFCGKPVRGSVTPLNATSLCRAAEDCGADSGPAHVVSGVAACSVLEEELDAGRVPLGRCPVEGRVSVLQARHVLGGGGQASRRRVEIRLSLRRFLTLFCALTAAPAPSRTSRHSTRSPAAAKRSGVHPSLSFASRSTPISRRAFTQSICPFTEARCSGVHSFCEGGRQAVGKRKGSRQALLQRTLFLTSLFAWCLRSRSMHSMFPNSAALWSAVS